MAQNIPLYNTLNGINRLSMLERNLHPTPQRPSMHEPIAANRLEYTLLASGINIGMEILETQRGRSTLQRLGTAVVEQWNAGRLHRFGGDARSMDIYVDRFLSTLRADFPNIISEQLGGPHVLASTERLGGWNGDLANFRPKLAVAVTFNQNRVADMVAATAPLWRSGQNNSPEYRKQLLRHKHFQFMLAVATAHELCHAFVAYLSQGGDPDRSVTPDGVTAIGFGQNSRGGTRRGRGESGRWFENALFGGTLEFYRDPTDDNGQVGIPYIIDSRDVAWRIHPAAILELVEYRTDLGRRQFNFPFRTTGPGLTARDRAQQRLRSLGSTQAGQANTGNTSFMQARRPPPLLMYNVPATELRRVPSDPRPLAVSPIRVA